MIFNFVFVANAAESSALKVNESGKFRIMLVNDTHDDAPRNPEIYEKTYTELTGEKGGIGPIDFISPWLYNVIINNTIGKIFALLLKVFG